MRYEILKEDKYKPDFSREVDIMGSLYPVWQYGANNKKRNLLLIGCGRLVFRSLPKEILKEFNIFVSDLYWSENYSLSNDITQKLSIDDLASHINELVVKLNIDSPFVLAHSCFGILALEAAKKEGSKLAGIILMASAPLWTDDSIKESLQRFRVESNRETIKQYNRQRESFERTKKPNESSLSVNAYIADTALYWGNPFIHEDFIRELWQGVEVSEFLANHFWGNLLPNIYRDKLSNNIEKVACPVLLLGGQRDYDSCPLSSWKKKFRPPNFTIIDCGEVGHWPSLEAPEIFFDGILDWRKKIV